MNNTESFRPFVETWLRRIWKEGDPNVVSELCHEDMDVVLSRQIVTSHRDEFREFVAAIRSTFSACEATIVDFLESGDRVAAFCTFRGTRISDGREMDFDFSFIGRIREGRWTEARNVVDYSEMLACLGEIQPETVAKALGV